MSRHWLCALAITSILGTTGSVFAQPPRNPAGPAAQPASPSKFLAIPGLAPLSMESVQRDLRLTPDQKQKLRAVSDAYAAQVQQLDKSYRGFSPEEQKTRAETSATSFPSPLAAPSARPRRFSTQVSCRSWRRSPSSCRPALH